MGVLSQQRFDEGVRSREEPERLPPSEEATTNEEIGDEADGDEGDDVDG